MAYVDDLIISGETGSVQNFFKKTQKAFSLKHVDYLTADHSIDFLGRIIKTKKSGQITMEFLISSLIGNLLGWFDAPAKSLPMVSRFTALQKKIRSNVTQSSTQNIALRLESFFGAHNSEMRSNTLSRSFHVLCRILKILTLY